MAKPPKVSIESRREFLRKNKTTEMKPGAKQGRRKKRQPSSSPKVEGTKAESRISKKKYIPQSEDVCENEVIDLSVSDIECMEVTPTNEMDCASTESDINKTKSKQYHKISEVEKTKGTYDPTIERSKCDDTVVNSEACNLISLVNEAENEIDNGSDSCGVNDSLYDSLREFAKNYNECLVPSSVKQNEITPSETHVFCETGQSQNSLTDWDPLRAQATTYGAFGTNEVMQNSASKAMLNQPTMNNGLHQWQMAQNPMNNGLNELESQIASNIAKLNPIQQNCPTTKDQGDASSHNYSEENNVMLKSAMSSLERVMNALKGIDETVKRNGNSIDCLNLRLLKVEECVNKTVPRLVKSVSSLEANHRGLATELDSRTEAAFEYIDQKAAIVDEKIDSEISKLEQAYKASNEVLKTTLIPDLIDNKMRKNIQSQDYQTCVKEIVEEKIKGVMNECKKALDDHSAKIAHELSAYKDQCMASLNEIKAKPSRAGNDSHAASGARPSAANTVSTGIANDDGIRIELDALKLDFKKYVKKTDMLDLKSRRNNIIIDQLYEIENEDVVDRLDTIFKNTLSDEDFGNVVIVKAYRMGNKNANTKCRKIMVELSSSLGRDICLQQAIKVTKSGNDGRPFYLNEDMAEDAKRKKMDLYRYIKYLEKRKHTVVKAGEDLWIDGVFYKSANFNSLPKGDRLMDSRTISNGGIIAFQSEHSPLSNLFPCNIKFNGVAYKSAEHCYQHLRAVHHKKNQLARDIMATDNPYDLIYQCKEITDNNEWCGVRISTMERIIRPKADQVPIFHEYLKATNDYRLVENTWNSFWGSGCSFDSKAVWEGSFHGLNHLGRILERIRRET